MPKQNKYSVVIYRHTDDEGTMEEVMDRWISADQVIDLLQTVEEDGVAGEEEESEEEEEEEESEPEIEEETPKPARGKQKDWDMEKAKELINEGKKPAAIAAEVEASIGSIYQLKSQMKKDGELGEPAPKVENKPVKSHQEQIVDMVAEGKSDTDIYNKMHDLMTAGEMRTAIEHARSL